MENTNLLMIPIWPLYNMNSVEDIDFDVGLSNYLKRGYDLSKRLEIYGILVWAKENSNYDFLGIMKNAPTPKKMKFLNNEVYIHLMNFKTFMENEEFGLLTDDRPLNRPWEQG
ncbi:hypothetical protein PG911_18610 [Tenacibaculum ovolyticum]|uniref:hypothetical protein n=1 Tax=Tenacibaculum ovolyticum TaxID=104270 RepID=UPI0022F3D8E4|nr:hypothetical protein [Tenacibaculum ovolyticum]WBX76599.1 hypothetical protein PG911_18610 [Tenacibaculum ovolyticum]